eukprot:gb/GECG01002422.1/.p1 GENE.gb/GECG01002422.1/~~gb/GECG01002422.1/.p1  ORF type:complete len:241 (+),score=34.65 gb/GECG01002422.1/:1-723(+)
MLWIVLRRQREEQKLAWTLITNALVWPFSWVLTVRSQILQYLRVAPTYCQPPKTDYAVYGTRCHDKDSLRSRILEHHQVRPQKKNDDGSAVDSIQRMAMTSLLVLPKEFIVRSPKRDGERALLQPLRKFATPAPLASARYSGEPNEGGTLDEVRIRIPAEYPSMAAENDDTLMERFHEDMLVHLQETTGNAEEQVEEKGGGAFQKDKEIHSLKEQVNALKEENQRWRTVNEKLKALHEQR